LIVATVEEEAVEAVEAVVETVVESCSLVY
jgi:hypothetical protein